MIFCHVTVASGTSVHSAELRRISIFTTTVLLLQISELYVEPYREFLQYGWVSFEVRSSYPATQKINVL
jgi:hypothetical protein